jgi:predicted RNA-binding Zn-ribbon protein involved in translation (DUF1610 family)
LLWAANQEEEMSKRKAKLICPKCGDEMNHHADKLVYPASPEDAKKMNAALGGVIEQTHGCPGCGAVESRRINE